MSRLISRMAVSWSRRLGELEGVFELALPVAVRRKAETLGHLARGVELEQLVRHVAHFGLDARLGAGPGGAAHAVERGLGFARAAEALHQVHARQRDVELGAAGVFEQHVVALGFALGDLPQPQVLRHAVLGMDHVVAGLEVDQVGGERGQGGFGRRAPGRPVRRFRRDLPSRILQVSNLGKRCRAGPAP